MDPWANLLIVLVTAVCTVASATDGTGEAMMQGRFKWLASGPLIAPSDPNEFFSIKDPTVVRHDGAWHLFCTVRGKKRSHQIEYLTFKDWKDTGKATRRMLGIHPGFYCAPQVFYFAPHKTWYLLCQASSDDWNPKYGAAYATTDTIADPASWSALKPLGHRHAGKKAGLDYWIICDDKKAHLFFTTLDGRMWREETSLKAFPAGWSEPVLAFKGDIFEASHTYRLKGAEKYLTLIEAQAGGRRYFKAYTADRLDGAWTPLAASRETPFASPANVRFAGEKWTDSFSHGELLRAGCDERLEVDPAEVAFLFQGVADADKRGKPYGQIPWRLGLLRPAR